MLLLYAVVTCCYLLLLDFIFELPAISSFCTLCLDMSWLFTSRLRRCFEKATVRPLLRDAIRSPKHTAQGGFGVRTLGHSMKISISVSSKSRFLVVRPSIFPTYLNFYLQNLFHAFRFVLVTSFKHASSHSHWCPLLRTVALTPSTLRGGRGTFKHYRPVNWKDSQGDLLRFAFRLCELIFHTRELADQSCDSSPQ